MKKIIFTSALLAIFILPTIAQATPYRLPLERLACTARLGALELKDANCNGVADLLEIMKKIANADAAEPAASPDAEPSDYADLQLEAASPTTTTTPKDSDGDSYVDSADNCPFDWNPDQRDRDDDGIGDFCDDCMFMANPDQYDEDGDNRGDACEDDADGDGVKDEVDNCPTIPNADQANRDQDEKGDVCDVGDPFVAPPLPPNKPTTYPSIDNSCSLVTGAQAGSGTLVAAILWMGSAMLIASRRKAKK